MHLAGGGTPENPLPSPGPTMEDLRDLRLDPAYAEKLAADPRFNTPIHPSEEAAFQRWKAHNSPGDSGWDYDLKGAFKAGLKRDPESGHLDDQFKKPNHATFSVFSRYAKDMPQLAGTWNGNDYIPPKMPVPEPRPVGVPVHLAGGGTPEDPNPYPGSFDVAPYQWPVGVSTGPEMLQAPNPPPDETATPLPVGTLKLRARENPDEIQGPVDPAAAPHYYPTSATEEDIYGSGHEGAIQSYGVRDFGPMPTLKLKKGQKPTKKQQEDLDSRIKIATIARGAVTDKAKLQQQYLTNAAAAAHHSPIASMGFDPRHMKIFDDLIDKAGVAGVYMPVGAKQDKNVPVKPDEIGLDIRIPSAAIHESVHRGLQMIRDKYPDQYNKIVGKSGVTQLEEYLVRGIQYKTFGGIEPSEDYQTFIKMYPGHVPAPDNDAINQVTSGKKMVESDKYGEIVDNLEKLAAHHIATTRPGGPR